MDELRELIQLIRENEFTEFELEREGSGFVSPRRRSLVDRPSSAAVTASESRVISGYQLSGRHQLTTSCSAGRIRARRPQTEASEDQDLHIIPSPIVGTFYRAASPNAESL